MLRGRATRSADGVFQRRCHVSSVYPAARVFAFGSTCMRRAGEGASIISGCCYGLKQQLPFKEKRKEVHYRNLRGNFPLGKMQAPGGQKARVGLEVVLFPAVWELSRGSLPSARGAQALYPIGRPTAWIAWTVQPMRPQQRDRAAESRAFPPRHGWCGKPVSLQQGSFASSSSQFHSPSPVSLFPSRLSTRCQPPAATTHTNKCPRGLPQCTR